MLYVVVRRGEGRDVRQGGAAHRGVGALALGHALRRGNFVMPSLFIHSKKVNIMIATDTLTSAYRFFMYIKWHKKFYPSLVRFFRAPFAGDTRCEYQDYQEDSEYQLCC